MLKDFKEEILRDFDILRDFKGTRSPPAKSKKAARGPQNGQLGLEIFGRSSQLRFFDPSPPFMRKGGGRNKIKWF